MQYCKLLHEERAFSKTAYDSTINSDLWRRYETPIPTTASGGVPSTLAEESLFITSTEAMPLH